MTAALTDKFTKAADGFSTTVGSTGVTDAVVTSIALTSVTGLPTDTAFYLTIDRVDSNGNLTPAKEESIMCIVASGNNITVVRGVEGTAQSHSAGAVVEMRLLAVQHNSSVDAFLTEHNQDGTHKLTPIYSALYEEDTGGDDAYVATVPTVTVLAAGQFVRLKVATANTGAASLDVNSLGVKAIQKMGASGLEDLADGDIKADSVVELVYDGTVWQYRTEEDKYFISVVMSADQPSLPDNVTIKVNLDTINDFAGGANADFNTTSKRWVCPETGVYEIYAKLLQYSGAWNIFTSNVYIYRNGYNVNNSTIWSGDGNDPIATPQVTHALNLNAGDYIEIFVNADINTTISATLGRLLAGVSNTIFQVKKI